MYFKNKGKIGKIAFLFSCPGKQEFKHGMPVAGNTGKNLDILIRILRKNHSVKKYFPYEKRYHYRIANASCEVIYKKISGRTEPTNKDIKDEENIKRLQKELKDVRIIILFGKKAQFAYQLLDFDTNIKSIAVLHLSNSALNRNIHIENEITGMSRTEQRLEFIAEKIIEELNEINI